MFIVNHEVLLFDPIGVVPCVYTIYYKHVIPSGLGFCHANITPHSSTHTTIIFCPLCATFVHFAVNHPTTVKQILRYTQNDMGLTTITIPKPRTSLSNRFFTSFRMTTVFDYLRLMTFPLPHTTYLVPRLSRNSQLILSVLCVFSAPFAVKPPRISNPEFRISIFTPYSSPITPYPS